MTPQELSEKLKSAKKDKDKWSIVLENKEMVTIYAFDDRTYVHVNGMYEPELCGLDFIGYPILIPFKDKIGDNEGLWHLFNVLEIAITNE